MYNITFPWGFDPIFLKPNKRNIKSLLVCFLVPLGLTTFLSSSLSIGKYPILVYCGKSATLAQNMNKD